MRNYFLSFPQSISLRPMTADIQYQSLCSSKFNRSDYIQLSPCGYYSELRSSWTDIRLWKCFV